MGWGAKKKGDSALGGRSNMCKIVVVEIQCQTFLCAPWHFTRLLNVLKAS